MIALSARARGLVVSLALGVLASVAVGPPAAADPLQGACWIVGGPYPAGPEVDLDGDGNPEATLPNPGASLCVDVDTGLYDPVTLTCDGSWGECVLRVTAGHTGAATVDAAVCAEARPNVQPLCTSIDSGTIPLVPVQPRTICFGWSYGGIPCSHEPEG